MLSQTQHKLCLSSIAPSHGPLSKRLTDTSSPRISTVQISYCDSGLAVIGSATQHVVLCISSRLQVASSSRQPTMPFPSIAVNPHNRLACQRPINTTVSILVDQQLEALQTDRTSQVQSHKAEVFSSLRIEASRTLYTEYAALLVLFPPNASFTFDHICRDKRCFYLLLLLSLRFSATVFGFLPHRSSTYRLCSTPLARAGDIVE